MGVVHKVLAYITREKGGRQELLVFTHRDYPEAGLQVPAGTVKDGESVEAALAREVSEETGLVELRLVRKLGVYTYNNSETGQENLRHVFHLRAPDGTPDHWEWLETGGGEVPDNDGYVFQFYWLDLAGTIDLAGNQGDYLGVMRDA